MGGGPGSQQGSVNQERQGLRPLFPGAELSAESASVGEAKGQGEGGREVLEKGWQREQGLRAHGWQTAVPWCSSVPGVGSTNWLRGTQ